MAALQTAQPVDVAQEDVETSPYAREHLSQAKVQRPGWDAFLLAVLVMAHLYILGFAEGSLGGIEVQDVLNHPLLGNILPAAGERAMNDIGEGQMGPVGPRPGEPLGLLLNAITIGLLLAYFVVDLALSGRIRQWCKWVLLSAILITALALPTLKLALLRDMRGPDSYAHDGGVIQTEITIQYLLEGKNPYAEDYVGTPLENWGHPAFRTAVYHYPYLPWTFLFSAPFYRLGTSMGFYDQRLVYLALFAIALALAPGLVRGGRNRLALVAVLGLNPIMALDIIFGQNDVFVLSWLIFSLASWRHWCNQRKLGAHARWARTLSAICFGLACASKPTAWFFAPFYGLLLLRGSNLPWQRAGWLGLARAIPAAITRALPALIVLGLILLPYIVWDPYAFYDDVWRWSNGQGETGYQIWGWGASNFVLGLGLVSNRFDLWPFWQLEVLLALPLLLWFLRRQQRLNSLANACWHYGIFLLAFFYASRFLNENYLAYILAFFALGIFAEGIRGTERTEI